MVKSHCSCRSLGVRNSPVRIASPVLCIGAKHTKHFSALDTVISVTLYSASSRADKDLDSLAALFSQLEDSLSISKPESEIYRINHRTDSMVTVNGTLCRILSVCGSEFARSKGLFDVTVEPLKLLYGLESHQKENITFRHLRSLPRRWRISVSAASGSFRTAFW